MIPSVQNGGNQQQQQDSDQGCYISKFKDQYGRLQTIPADGFLYKGPENTNLKPTLTSINVTPVIEVRRLKEVVGKQGD